MDYWDHNSHYHPLLLAALPPGCERALDIGCGEGLLARRLRARVPHVTGIDPHEPSIEKARAADPHGRIDFVTGHFPAHSFEPGSFDMITCVATLHHLDATAALEGMCQLLVPGGTLAVLGLARSRLPRDLPWEAAGLVTHQVHRLRHGRTPSSLGGAPVLWPPPHDHVEIRELAEKMLPGVRYRRHALWRYSLIWTKPVPANSGRP